MTDESKTEPVFENPTSVTHWTCPKASSPRMTHHMQGSANKCAYCHRDAQDLREEQAEVLAAYETYAASVRLNSTWVPPFSEWSGSLLRP